MSKLLDEKEVFNCCRFNVLEKTYKREDGLEYKRFSVNPGDAVLILPITDQNEVICIKQLRESVGKICIEIPAGMIDKGENPIDAARRELEEETGLIAENMELLLEGFPSAGYTSEKIYIYLARNFKQGKVCLDETECIESIEKIKLDKMIELINNNELEEMNLIVAILSYKLKYCDK